MCRCMPESDAVGRGRTRACLDREGKDQRELKREGACEYVVEAIAELLPLYTLPFLPMFPFFPLIVDLFMLMSTAT